MLIPYCSNRRTVLPEVAIPLILCGLALVSGCGGVPATSPYLSHALPSFHGLALDMVVERIILDGRNYSSPARVFNRSAQGRDVTRLRVGFYCGEESCL